MVFGMIHLYMQEFESVSSAIRNILAFATQNTT